MYEDAWRDLRQKWNYLIASSLIGSALFVLIGLNITKGALILVTILILIPMIIVFRMYATWACPRCNNYYFMKTFWINLFRKKCLHCGLRKWDTVKG